MYLLPSRGKGPCLPHKLSSLTKAKKRSLMKKKKKMKVIHVDGNDENEARISSMMIQSKDAHIRDFQANIGRAKNVIHYFEVENKRVEAQKAIYEVKAIRTQKEAEKSKAKLDEALDRYGNTNEEEEQLPRRSPRTIGLNKALAKEREQEAALAE